MKQHPSRQLRVDESTLRADLERGLFAGPLGLLFRDPKEPLEPGQILRLGGIEIEVLSLAGDGSPEALLFRFPRPLEDASMRWVQWREGGYVTFRPPAVGRSISIPAAIGPLDRFGW